MPKISELFKRLFINTYLKMAATVKYLPWRGSQAAIIFLASNIWAVNSGTVRALYCWLPLAVNGANPGTKKCNRGNGTMLVANFLKSALSWPGNRHGIVTTIVKRQISNYDKNCRNNLMTTKKTNSIIQFYGSSVFMLLKYYNIIYVKKSKSACNLSKSLHFLSEICFCCHLYIGDIKKCKLIGCHSSTFRFLFIVKWC